MSIQFTSVTKLPSFLTKKSNNTPDSELFTNNTISLPKYQILIVSSPLSASASASASKGSI